MSKISMLLDKSGVDPSSSIRAIPNDWISRRKSDRILFTDYPKRSYSQFGEDSILRSVLPSGIGTYIDIGSGHPVAGSNTYALYEMGWTGVLIDPIRKNMELSHRLRPRDIFIQAACGQQSGMKINFFEFDVYEYSTTSEERVAELETMGHTISESYEVKPFALKDLLVDIPLGSLSVLSVDVEGSEIDVLMGNNWRRYQPTFIIVEEWEAPLGKETEVGVLLSRLGCRLTAFTGLSSVYVMD